MPNKNTDPEIVAIVKIYAAGTLIKAYTVEFTKELHRLTSIFDLIDADYRIDYRHQ